MSDLVIEYQLPTLPAPAWQMIDRRLDGARYRRKDGLFVIVSAAIEDDGYPWLHVSLSRKKQLPAWEEIKYVKELFIGKDKYAYQIFPPTDKFVNIHPFVLHLWHPLKHQPIPEFSGILLNGVRSI